MDTSAAESDLGIGGEIGQPVLEVVPDCLWGSGTRSPIAGETSVIAAVRASGTRSPVSLCCGDWVLGGGTLP